MYRPDQPGRQGHRRWKFLEGCRSPASATGSGGTGLSCWRCLGRRLHHRRVHISSAPI